MAVLAAGGLVAGVLVGWSGLDTVNGCGLATEKYPTQSARDWVGNADVVVVARADGEHESGREELGPGTYSHWLERTVELSVEDKPFESTARSHPTVGKELGYVGAGWKLRRSDGKTRVPDLPGDSPRVMTGHTYILALRWDDKRWVPLGEGAVVPFDGAQAGRGEWCGQVMEPDDYAHGERLGRASDSSMEKTLLGKGVPALTKALDRAARKE